MSIPKVAVLSVVPSPYQRDLLGALSKQPEIQLNVFYQERQPHDSPWPDATLAAHERILPGFYLRVRTVRSHWNWSLPPVDDFDLWVVNASLTSITVQWLLRWKLSGRRWLFWGERLRGGHSKPGKALQNILAAPLRKAAGILSIGGLAQADYQRRFPKARHWSIPYCTRLDGFFNAQRKALEDCGNLTFLFCGQMIHRKGIDLLLKAFERLVDEGRKVWLLLVGREAELPALFKGLSEAARNRITYEGFVAPEMLPRYFAAADVFVLPSRHDGWGVVVNQALAAGLPVLSSDAVGAARDLVENEVNGLLFEAGNGSALLEAMRYVLDRREVLEEWGAASVQRARQLTPEIGARRLVDAIGQTLDIRK